MSANESCESSEMVSVDPWDILNNFCFHVYAQKSLFQNLQTCKLFIGENDNEYFWTPAPSPVSLEFIELVPS